MCLLATIRILNWRSFIRFAGANEESLDALRGHATQLMEEAYDERDKEIQK